MSALELAFCTARLAVHLQWSVLLNLQGSDPYPKIYTYPHNALLIPDIRTGSPRALTLRVILSQCQLRKEFLSVDSVVEYFTYTLLQAAASHVSTPSTRPPRVPIPRWTDECRDVTRARKSAPQRFQIHPTGVKSNFIQAPSCYCPAHDTRRQAHVLGGAVQSFPVCTLGCRVKLRPTSVKCNQILPLKCCLRCHHYMPTRHRQHNRHVFPNRMLLCQL